MVVCKKKIKISMSTLIFGLMVARKERIYERGSYIFVEWLCANKPNKFMRTLTVGPMVVH